MPDSAGRPPTTAVPPTTPPVVVTPPVVTPPEVLPAEARVVSARARMIDKCGTRGDVYKVVKRSGVVYTSKGKVLRQGVWLKAGRIASPSAPTRPTRTLPPPGHEGVEDDVPHPLVRERPGGRTPAPGRA